MILDRTIMHPQGGGQPSDEGYLQNDDAKFTVEALGISSDVIQHIGKFDTDKKFEAD